MLICLVVVACELYALMDNCGFLSKRYHVGFLAYYTNLSNIMVLAYFACKLAGLKLTAVIDLVVTLTITVTFMIYHFVLFPSEYKNYKEGKITWNLFGATNLMLHYICPLLTVLYWVVICDKSTLVWYDGLKFLIVPLCYCIYIAIRKLLGISIDNEGSYYPYDFMNVDKFGLKAVARNIAILLVFFGTLSIIVSVIARIL